MKKILSFALLFLLAASANAQNNPAAGGSFNPQQPGPIGGVTAAGVSSTSGLDASLISGVGDMCSKISQTAIALAVLNPYGGKIKAESFWGLQHCAASMFANWPAPSGHSFTVEIDFGAVTILTDVAQNPPTLTKLSGQLSYGISAPGNPGGTTIQASTVFPNNTPVVSMGNGQVSSGVTIENMRITCQPPSGSNPTGCTALQNHWAQNGSMVTNVILDGGTTTDFDVDTSNAQNSGPYTMISMAQNGVNSASATCANIGSSSAVALVFTFFNSLNCGGAANGTAPTVGIAMDASNVMFSGLQLENATNGMRIGANQFVHAVVIGQHGCNGATYTVTNCLLLSNANSVDEIAIMGGNSLSGTGVTNALVDQQTPTCTIPISSEHGVGFYSRGYAGGVQNVLSNSSVCPSVLGTIKMPGSSSGTLLVTPPATTSGTATLNPGSENVHGTVFYATCSGTLSSSSGAGGLSPAPWNGTSAVTCQSPALTTPAPFTGTLKNLEVTAGTGGVSSSSGVVTIHANGSDTSVTCTLGTGTSCSDTTHTAAVTQGQTFNVKVTTQGSETLANVSFSFELSSP